MDGAEVQWVTHLAAGAVLGRWARAAGAERSGRARAGAWTRKATAIVGAIGSHVLLDDLALATYHPPRARLHDPFWLGVHVAAALGALAIAVRLRALWPYLVAACLPDLDWVLGRPLGWWRAGAVHAALRALPGLAVVSKTLRAHVPDWREAQAALFVELAVLAASWLAYRSIVSSRDAR